VKICTAAPPLPSTIAPVPAAFDAWFLKGMHKDPAERFRSALEMADELHALLSAEGLGADSRQRSSTDRRFPPDKVDPAARARSSGPPAAETPNAPSREPTLLTSTGAVATEVLQRPTAARRVRYALVAGLLLLAAGVLALGPGRALFAGSVSAEAEKAPAERANEATPASAQPAPAAANGAAGAVSSPEPSLPSSPARVDPPTPSAATPVASEPAPNTVTRVASAPPAAPGAAAKPTRNPKPPRAERPVPPKMPAQPATPSAPKPATPSTATPAPATPFDPYSDRL
jgi:hypothetical protein